MNNIRSNLKMCPKCGKNKDISQFYRRGENGLQSHCIDCCKEHGRLRNGTTGIYRNNNNNLNINIMKDFTFYDFTNGVGQGRKLAENSFSINNKKGNRYVTFGKDKSLEIIQGGFEHLRVREDNITGDLHFVFTKDMGLSFGYKNNNKSVIINNKQLVEFLSMRLGVNLGDNKAFKISDNMSKTSEFLTYKIIK